MCGRSASPSAQTPATGTGKQTSFTHYGDKHSVDARRRELVELYGAQVVPAPPTSARMTVRELLETFLTSPHADWSPTTWRTHTGHGRMLCRDRLGRARLDRITHNTVERAIARWIHTGHSCPRPRSLIT